MKKIVICLMILFFLTGCIDSFIAEKETTIWLNTFVLKEENNLDSKENQFIEQIKVNNAEIIPMKNNFDKSNQIVGLISGYFMSGEMLKIKATDSDDYMFYKWENEDEFNKDKKLEIKIPDNNEQLIINLNVYFNKI